MNPIAATGPTTGAIVLVVGHDPTALAHTWLTGGERRLADERGERGWAGHIAGRAAAKQAIADAFRACGLPTPAAADIEITNDGHGRPAASVGTADPALPVTVSIAHTGIIGVALASVGAAADIGVDIEPVEPRSTRFERMVLTAAERALPPFPGDDRDTWLTRLWAAKETAAKAGGLGLQGRPKAFEITERAGRSVRVAGRWVDTEVVTLAGVPHIVAATPAGREGASWPSS